MARRPSRYAPNAPSGIATTTVNVCASPVAPRSAVPSAPMAASAAGAGDAEPSPV